MRFFYLHINLFVYALDHLCLFMGDLFQYMPIEPMIICIVSLVTIHVENRIHISPHSTQIRYIHNIVIQMNQYGTDNFSEKPTHSVLY